MEEILVGAIGLLIVIVITRFIFGIDIIIGNLKKQTQHAESQTKLLAYMAEKQGVPEDVVKKCLPVTPLSNAERLKRMNEKKNSEIKN